MLHIGVVIFLLLVGPSLLRCFKLVVVDSNIVNVNYSRVIIGYAVLSYHTEYLKYGTASQLP